MPVHTTSTNPYLATCVHQDEMVQCKVIKPPSDAILAAKATAKGKKANKRKTPGSVNQSAAGFRRYVSPGGYEVLVGRNNKQNDVLSHQVANPQDIWLHARGLPGSHTVLRLPPGKQPEDGDVQFAANLAAWFSKARDSSKVDVIVTRVACLKKLKGGKPGQVLVTKEEGGVLARPHDSVACESS